MAYTVFPDSALKKLEDSWGWTVELRTVEVIQRNPHSVVNAEACQVTEKWHDKILIGAQPQSWKFLDTFFCYWTFDPKILCRKSDRCMYKHSKCNVGSVSGYKTPNYLKVEEGSLSTLEDKVNRCKLFWAQSLLSWQVPNRSKRHIQAYFRQIKCKRAQTKTSVHYQ